MDTSKKDWVLIWLAIALIAIVILLALWCEFTDALEKPNTPTAYGMHTLIRPRPIPL
jgi:hypothetical protein